MQNKIRKILYIMRLPFSKMSAALSRKIKNSFIVSKLSEYPLGNRILNEPLFRAKISLTLGLLINFLYGAVQFAIGIFSRSVWLGALAVYHILLAVIRFLLLRHMHKNGIGGNYKAELRQYRRCGVYLFLMTPVFASILVLVMSKNSHTEYPELMIYIAAVYAFCKIGIAFSNTIKFKAYGSPIMCAAKDVSLISALISILTLETAIIARYGNMQNPVFYQGMLGTVGGAICIFVLGKAIFMVVRASKQLKTI